MFKILVILMLVLGAYLVAKRFMASGGQMTVTQARQLLEVDENADADAINAAHKRLIAKVHPDTGGSAQLAAQVNAARDLLLRTLPR